MHATHNFDHEIIINVMFRIWETWDWEDISVAKMFALQVYEPEFDV